MKGMLPTLVTVTVIICQHWWTAVNTKLTPEEERTICPNSAWTYNAHGNHCVTFNLYKEGHVTSETACSTHNLLNWTSGVQLVTIPNKETDEFLCDYVKNLNETTFHISSPGEPEGKMYTNYLPGEPRNDSQGRPLLYVEFVYTPSGCGWRSSEVDAKRSSLCEVHDINMCMRNNDSCGEGTICTISGFRETDCNVTMTTGHNSDHVSPYLTIIAALLLGCISIILGFLVYRTDRCLNRKVDEVVDLGVTSSQDHRPGILSTASSKAGGWPPNDDDDDDDDNEATRVPKPIKWADVGEAYNDDDDEVINNPEMVELKSITFSECSTFTV